MPLPKRRGLKTDSRLFNSAFWLKVLPKIPSGQRARAPQKSPHPQIEPSRGLDWRSLLCCERSLSSLMPAGSILRQRSEIGKPPSMSGAWQCVDRLVLY